MQCEMRLRYRLDMKLEMRDLPGAYCSKLIGLNGIGLDCSILAVNARDIFWNTSLAAKRNTTFPIAFLRMLPELRRPILADKSSIKQLPSQDWFSGRRERTALPALQISKSRISCISCSYFSR